MAGGELGGLEGWVEDDEPEDDEPEEEDEPDEEGAETRVPDEPELGGDAGCDPRSPGGRTVPDSGRREPAGGVGRKVTDTGGGVTVPVAGVVGVDVVDAVVEEVDRGGDDEDWRESRELVELLVAV